MDELASVDGLLSNHLFDITLEIRGESELSAGFPDDRPGLQSEQIGGGLVCIDESSFEVQHIDRIGRCNQDGAEQPGLHLFDDRVLLQRFRDYSPSIRMFERGIALAIDEGDFDRGLALCSEAIALGLGPAYQAKRASIERMI